MANKREEPWQRRIKTIAERVRAGCRAVGLDVPVDVIVKDLTRAVGELAQTAGVHRGVAVDRLPPVADLVSRYCATTMEGESVSLSGPRTIAPGDVTPGDVAALMCNPIYAIQIDEQLCLPHEPMLDEDTWVAANVRMIDEIGAEAWLRNLLSVLKGNWVADQDLDPGTGD